MIYLIKFIFIILISCKSIAVENSTNEILFKINNKVFTNVDLETRTEYVAIINNFDSSKFSKLEKQEILDDYISSLIFYEYYNKNKIAYINLNDEVDILYNNNFSKKSLIDKEIIKNFRLNTKIDLIRNKIIEEKINSNKSNLLKETNTIDLLYNYNLQYIIFKQNLLDKKLIKNINNRDKFNDLKRLLKENQIDFFYKEEDINDNNIISKKIKEIINQNIPIYINYENGYINIISINKNLESYEGIFVKLINFTSNKPFEEQDLKCNNINKTLDINKTIFKEYEYSKLNDNIKKNLKSINDFILFNENGNYNYIVLCNLTYDEKLLKNINFSKKVNSLVKKIQNNFLIKYKDEYKFTKIK